MTIHGLFLTCILSAAPAFAQDAGTMYRDYGCADDAANTEMSARQLLPRLNRVAATDQALLSAVFDFIMGNGLQFLRDIGTGRLVEHPRRGWLSTAAPGADGLTLGQALRSLGTTAREHMLAEQAVTQYLESRASRLMGSRFEYKGRSLTTAAARRLRSELRGQIEVTERALNPVIRGQTQPFQRALPGELENQARQAYISCRADSAAGGEFSTVRCDDARIANYGIREIYNRASMGSGLQVTAAVNALELTACAIRVMAPEKIEELMPHSAMRPLGIFQQVELRSCLVVDLTHVEDARRDRATLNGVALSFSSVVQSQQNPQCLEWAAAAASSPY